MLWKALKKWILNKISENRAFVYKVIRILLFLSMLMGFMYQATNTLLSYLRYPTAIDVLIESSETLRFPGISLCITNWVKKEKFCQRYPTHCNGSTVAISKEEIKQILDTDGNLGEIALTSTEVIQTTFEDPTLYYFKFIYEDWQIEQTFSRLPSYMCYTLNWKGNEEMKAYHEYPPLFDFSLFITWKVEEIIELDRYIADVGLHHIETLDAGAKHTIILEPNSYYEFSVNQKGIKSLPEPYETRCVDYEKFGQYRYYPAYMTQQLCKTECQMNITKEMCGCIIASYPFRNRLNDIVCDKRTTRTCVQAKAKLLYDEDCPAICGSPCDETVYETLPGFQSKESSSPFNGFYFINMKLIIPSRYVDILKTIPKLTPTNVLAIFGGYLGFWLGSSIFTTSYAIGEYIRDIILTRLKGTLSKGSVSCIFDVVFIHTRLSCVVFCFIQAFYDYSIYIGYPTAVQYADDKMVDLRFPAITLCLDYGYNLTRMCDENKFMNCSDEDSQRIIGTYLNITHFLIAYAYPVDKFVFDCTITSEEPTCDDFSCIEFWKAMYTYTFETICYTFDLSRIKDKGHPYLTCPSPWKYKVFASVAAAINSKGSDSPYITGHLHETNVLGSGEKNTMKFLSGHSYKLASFQTNIRSLPKPYETMCTDYVKKSKELNYPENRMQPVECAEHCLMNKWDEHCTCFSKLYALKHYRKGTLCDIFLHIQCIDRMKLEQWRPYCLKKCSQPCNEVRYKTYIFPGSKVKSNDSRPNAVEFTLQMATEKRRLVAAYPRMTIDNLVTYLEGHIGMWLGIAIANAVYSCFFFIKELFVKIFARKNYKSLEGSINTKRLAQGYYQEFVLSY